MRKRVWVVAGLILLGVLVAAVVGFAPLRNDTEAALTAKW